MVAVSTLMPAVLGRYQVEAVIGRGSSGRVLRVRDAKGTETPVGSVPLGDGALEVPDAVKGGIGALVLAGLGNQPLVFFP